MCNTKQNCGKSKRPNDATTTQMVVFKLYWLLKFENLEVPVTAEKKPSREKKRKRKRNGKL